MEGFDANQVLRLVRIAEDVAEYETDESCSFICNWDEVVRAVLQELLK